MEIKDNYLINYLLLFLGLRLVMIKLPRVPIKLATSTTTKKTKGGLINWAFVICFPWDDKSTVILKRTILFSLGSFSDKF